MTAVNLSFPKQEEKFSLRQLGRIVSKGAAARRKPNVPENSRQQPGSPWLLIVRNKDEEGLVIGDNATGETLTPLVGEEENSGACQLFEVCLPPYRPCPPLHYHVDFIETFTAERGQLDIYVDRDQKYLLLLPGDRATAHIRQPHRFADDHDEPVIFTIKTEPAGGVVKAFQLAYGIANDGGAGKDGLPKNPIARQVFIKTTQGYLPAFPRTLKRIVFSCAALVAKPTGLEKRWRAYFT